MASKILEAVGKNGQMTLYDDRLVILRTGTLKGKKEVPLSQISTCRFKECSKVAAGFLQVSILGEVPKKGTVLNAASDENAVVFGSANPVAILDADMLETVNAPWRRLAEEITRRAEASRQRTTGAPPAVDGIDELERLANLRDRGVLSDSEFQALRVKVIARMQAVEPPIHPGEGPQSEATRPPTAARPFIPGDSRLPVALRVYAALITALSVAGGFILAFRWVNQAASSPGSSVILTLLLCAIPLGIAALLGRIGLSLARGERRAVFALCVLAALGLIPGLLMLVLSPGPLAVILLAFGLFWVPPVIMASRRWALLH